MPTEQAPDNVVPIDAALALRVARVEETLLDRRRRRERTGGWLVIHEATTGPGWGGRRFSIELDDPEAVVVFIRLGPDRGEGA